MSRARNIKPGFFKNDELGDCSIYARVLFAGLWCEADPRGIVEDRPKRLKIEILPYDNVDVDALLNELAAHDFIQRYEVGGVRCIKVVNFQKHQNPHQNEKNNDLPDAPTAVLDAGQMPAPEDSGASTVQAPERHRSNRDDSLNTESLIAEPLNPSSLIPENEHMAKTRPKKSRSPGQSPPKPSAASLDADFEARFYGPYPRHVKRDDALKAWLKLSDDERDAAADGVRRWLDGGAFSPDVAFVPYPASWLNGRRWSDDIAAVNPPKAAVAVNGFTLDDERAFRKANPLLRVVEP